jgi:hypothetical protein
MAAVNDSAKLSRLLSDSVPVPDDDAAAAAAAAAAVAAWSASTSAA